MPPIFEKSKTKKKILVPYKTFVLKICKTIQRGNRSNYLKTWIVFGCKKTRIPNTKYCSVLRKSEYRIQILPFGPTIQIVFEYRIILHTLVEYIMRSVLYTIYSIQFAVHWIKCTVYHVQLTLHSLQYTVYIRLSTKFSIIYEVDSTQYNVWSKLYTVYSLQCSVYTVSVLGQEGGYTVKYNIKQLLVEWSNGYVPSPCNLSQGLI